MRRLAAAAAALVVIVLAVVAAAETRPRSDVPTLLSADEVAYDQDLGLITASGKVEIAQGQRVLLADKVTYNERTGDVTASGNVSLLEPTGDVLFADYVELTDELKNGFIRDVRVLLADNSRLAANTADRRDGNTTILDRAVYSPCNLCPTDPTRPPLWQIKAVKVVHDQQAKVIEYKDATMEVFGLPVAYLPYFRHPDPTVDRQSGLLMPSFSRNDYFGLRARVPYYWALGSDREAIVTPELSEKEGAQLQAEYRQRTEKGEFFIDGSGTYVDERDDNGDPTGDKEFRGHIRSLGRFRIDDGRRWGFNLFRASDDTYLRRYTIPGGRLDTLTSRLFAESVQGRSYGIVDSYAFQSVRPDDPPGSTPIVLPDASYSWTGEPSERGGRFLVDANMLSLYRTEGTDTRRLSFAGGWQLPYYAPAGDVYTLTAQLRGDGYWVNEGVDGANPEGSEQSTLTGRLRPLLALDWRWPWVSSDGRLRHVIEPMASVVLTPYGGNPGAIPNEDSQSFEFDDTNLFSLSRFPGIDRYESGPRLSYGLRAGTYGGGGYSELFAGQILKPREDNTFPAGSGLVGQKSDYVARATIAPSRYFSFIDRIRVDQDSLELRRHEVLASMGPNALRLSVSYAALDRSLFSDDFGNREAVTLSLFARLTEHWSFFGQHSRDLTDDGGSLLNYLGLRYTDECLDIIFYAERDFVTVRDLRPSTTFGVRFLLANLS